MSEGKGADDLHVFDELLKSKSSESPGPDLPPPAMGLAGVSWPL